MWDNLRGFFESKFGDSSRFSIFQKMFGVDVREVEQKKYSMLLFYV